jgi:ATP-binding cassette subfamily C protein
VVIVAHRMGILGVVDKIMVLREGRVETLGARDEVLGRLKAIQTDQPTPAQAAEG